MKETIKAVMLYTLLLFTQALAQDTTKFADYYSAFTENNYPDSSMHESERTISLASALKIMFENNPLLKVNRKDILAFKATALQAEQYPNPEIGMEMENIFGSGNYGGIKGSENTFYLSQDLVLSSKLSEGKKVELLKSNIAMLEYEKTKIVLISEVRKLFVKLSSLQHLNKLNKKLLKLSNEFQNNLERRIKAGKVSPAEASRASLISTSLEIKIENTHMKYQSALQQLYTLLGKPGLVFNDVENICSLKYKIPEFNKLKKLLENYPDLSKYSIDLERREVEINLEKAKAIPDLSLSVGYRRINETNDNTMLFGASIPINIFNNNSGNIQHAEIRAEQTKENYQGIKNNYHARILNLLNNAKALENMIDMLSNKSLPKARSAFEIIQKGNLLGRFTVLDVLDSQRSLYELESQFVNAVVDYNLAVIELEALTLTKFDNIKNERMLNHE